MRANLVSPQYEKHLTIGKLGLTDLLTYIKSRNAFASNNHFYHQGKAHVDFR